MFPAFVTSRLSVLAFAAAALASAPVLADSPGHGTPATTQVSNVNNNASNSGATAIVAPVTNQYAPNRIKQRIDTTASAIAPGLTAAGVHSCAGSAALGVGGTGFNFGFGSTYEMVECNRRAYAATLAGMGQNAAALALICNNAEVRAALNQTGVICPQQVATTAGASYAPGAAPVVSAYASLGPSAGAHASNLRNPCHGTGSADMIECARLASAAPAPRPAAADGRRLAPSTPHRSRVPHYSTRESSTPQQGSSS
jgi:hypothetical protein